MTIEEQIQLMKAPKMSANTLGPAIANIAGGIAGEIPFQQVLANISDINTKNAQVKAMNTEMQNKLLMMKLEASLGLQREKRAQAEAARKEETHELGMRAGEFQLGAAKFAEQREQAEEARKEKLFPSQLRKQEVEVEAEKARLAYYKSRDGREAARQQHEIDKILAQVEKERALGRKAEVDTTKAEYERDKLAIEAQTAELKYNLQLNHLVSTIEEYGPDSSQADLARREMIGITYASDYRDDPNALINNLVKEDPWLQALDKVYGKGSPEQRSAYFKALVAAQANKELPPIHREYMKSISDRIINLVEHFGYKDETQDILHPDGQQELKDYMITVFSDPAVMRELIKEQPVEKLRIFFRDFQKNELPDVKGDLWEDIGKPVNLAGGKKRRKPKYIGPALPFLEYKEQNPETYNFYKKFARKPRREKMAFPNFPERPRAE